MKALKVKNSIQLVPTSEVGMHSASDCSCDPSLVSEGSKGYDLIIHKYLEGERKGKRVQRDYQIWKFNKG